MSDILNKEEQPFRLSPEKLFYKIGEVSKITGLEPHVIRYWEKMFPDLKPKKSKTGQRVFLKKDIDLLLLIKRLQEEEGYTLEGIKKKLSKAPPLAPPCDLEKSNRDDLIAILEVVKKRLKEIVKDLD